jgi:hypothetical protein
MNAEVQPGTKSPCDSSHACEITATGPLEDKTFFKADAEIGTARFVMVVTIDFADVSTNGTGGKCYPGGGHVSVTPQIGPAGTLILDFQGRAWNSWTTGYRFDGPWTTDTGSNGQFNRRRVAGPGLSGAARPDAIAAYNWGLGNVDAWVGKRRPAAALPLEVEHYRDRVLRETGLPAAPLLPAPPGN